MEIGGDDDGSSPSRKRLPPFPRAIFVSLEVPFASLHDVARSLDRLVVAREHDVHLVRNAENVFHAVAEFPDGSTGKPVDQLTLCPVEGVPAHQGEGVAVGERAAVGEAELTGREREIRLSVLIVFGFLVLQHG